MSVIEKKLGIFNYNKNTNKVYVIGDIHGDYQCLVHCLVDLCNVCNITELINDDFHYTNREHLEWNKSNSIVIFCGDLIHRQRFENNVLDDECSDIYIMQTLIRLKKDAQKYNGNIIIISGNHEIMNIMQPNENMYTSPKNLNTNIKYFSNKSFVNEYISNSYAWIKFNDILIAHGGLCSDYLSYLNGSSSVSSSDLKGDNIIEFVNRKYREYFKNFDLENVKTDMDGYNLFVNYDLENKTKHNMFWCREWGYDGIDCDNYSKILSIVDCKKMIIAHCPQFLSPEKPKMINFECPIDGIYQLAKIDVGMSRSFDSNKPDEFIFYLTNNYNRKMSILKLNYLNNQLFFNNSSIITKKLSCIQYLLLKYGLKRDDWINKKIDSNWLGFEYVDTVIKKINEMKEESSDFITSLESKCSNSLSKKNSRKNFSSISDAENTVVLCLLYPLIKIDLEKIPSVEQFNMLIHLGHKSKMSKIKKIKKIIKDL